MFCAISGGIPEEPVVSADGHVFERRLVEKHIEETGRHPVTNEDLKKEDLIPLQTNKVVKPRPAPVASIPGLLGLFHNEWDALMLETYSLQQSLHSTRQELAHALYQHDAACRVIARLTRERDEARTNLETAAAAQPQATTANGKRAAEDGPDSSAAKKAKGGFTSEVVEAMTATSNELSKARKARVAPPELETADGLAAFSQQSARPLHKTGKGGIKTIDVSPVGGSSVVATGGADGVVVVFDTKAGRIVSQLKGHSKKVNSVKFLGQEGIVVSASSDNTARLWRTSEDNGTMTCAAVLKDHSAEVTSVTGHPSASYFVTASLDASWAFYDVGTADCLSIVKDSETAECGITTAEFHPDGIILGTGFQDSVVRIWEARQQKVVAKFEGHSGALSGMSFSENGYYLATCAPDGVKLWDLRKLRNFKTLTPDGGATINSVSFDKSGHYLSVGSSADVKVYATKQDWSVVTSFVDLPKHGASSVRFGEYAECLYVGCNDHNLRTYSTATADGAAAS